jgi:hypothetical protein
LFIGFGALLIVCRLGRDAVPVECTWDLRVAANTRTVPGHIVATLVLVAAVHRHDIASRERASLMLRDAPFEHGCDISCPDELAAVAELVTLPGPISTADQVLADWREGQRRGAFG